VFQGPEVRSGDLPRPIMLEKGQEFTFTIKRGVGTDESVSVNYDDFVNDVEKGDVLLVDGQYPYFILPFRIYLSTLLIEYPDQSSSFSTPQRTHW
jgi:hypothetical protein